MNNQHTLGVLPCHKKASLAFLYPEEIAHLQILWNKDETGKATDFQFMDMRDLSPEATAIRRSFRCSIGADCADWLRTRFPEDVLKMIIDDYETDIDTIMRLTEAFNQFEDEPVITPKLLKVAITYAYDIGKISRNEASQAIRALELEAV